MIRVLVALLLLVAPAGAAPAPLPTLFDVTGVAADDVLNIRAEPSAGAEVVGTLAPDAERVEVVALDASGRWGQVNASGRSGWVAMRFLAERPEVWGAAALPEGLRCRGTEPFWAVSAEGGALVLERPDTPALRGEIGAVLDAGAPQRPLRVVLAEDRGERLALSVVPQACSDGMSDIAFGLGATLTREGSGGPELLVGCCSLGG